MADHNRRQFTEAGLVLVHLMGSAGSGKTTLLEATPRALGHRKGPLGAICADLAGDRDGLRLRRAGFDAVSVSTGYVAHLDAELVNQALHRLDCAACELVFVENVGGLVDPVFYDLGERARVVVYSTAQGPELPLKYPLAFRDADMVVVTKTDLLPSLTEPDVGEIETALTEVMSKPRWIEVSVRSGQGLERWAHYLETLALAAAREAGAVRASDPGSHRGEQGHPDNQSKWARVRPPEGARHA